MSSSVLKTLSLTVLIVMVGVGGFVAGRYMSAPGSSRPDLKILAGKLGKKQKAYETIMPSVGTLIKTMQVELVSLEEGEMGTLLTPEQTKDVIPRQKVILYTHENKIYKEGAVIKGMGSSPEEPEETKIFFDMPEDVNRRELSNKADIIIFEYPLIKRLPFEVLSKDENGQAYIWRAEPTESGDAFIARRHPIEVGVMGDDYFESGIDVSTLDLIIRNPDADLKDGQAIAVTKTDMNAPVQTPLQFAWNEEIRRQAFLIDKAVKKAQQEAYQAGIQSCGATPKGPAVNADGSPIQQTLPSPPAGGGGCSGGGCGGTQAAQGQDGDAAAQGGGCGSCGGGAPQQGAAGADPAAGGGCGSCGGMQQMPSPQLQNQNMPMDGTQGSSPGPVDASNPIPPAPSGGCDGCGGAPLQ